MMKRLSFAVVVLLALIASAAAQTPPNVQSTVALFQNVRTVANVVYLRANGWEGKLDVYAQRTQTSTPVVIYIHGGGWVRGTKAGSVLSALPYLAMGYSVVNVEYRLADGSLAAAAVEDRRCAPRWVVGHAQDYNFDVGRIVVAGASAGGHLALNTGMIPTRPGFGRICPGKGEPRIAALGDFFWITDAAGLLHGPT